MFTVTKADWNLDVYYDWDEQLGFPQHLMNKALDLDPCSWALMLSTCELVGHALTITIYLDLDIVQERKFVHVSRMRCKQTVNQINVCSTCLWVNVSYTRNILEPHGETMWTSCQLRLHANPEILVSIYYSQAPNVPQRG